MGKSADVLIVSLGSTAGLRAADAELVASMRRAGASVATVRSGRPRDVRTFALTDFAWARAARIAARIGIERARPRAIIYSSTTAALLAPAPGAIRFDAPAAGNRPGRHGLWQKPVERRKLATAPLLLPWSSGALAEAPVTAAPAIVVPVPVEPSDGSPAPGRDIAAMTYGAHPEKKGLDLVLAAWRKARKEGEVLVVTGIGPGDVARLLGPEACETPGTIFTGAVSRDDHRALMRRARVFVTAPRREDYGIVQLEALADGCRLVTSASPGPYAALPLATELDSRLVGHDVASGLRAALDDPVPGYSERARELLEPWRTRTVDELVSTRLLPALLGS